MRLPSGVTPALVWLSVGIALAGSAAYFWYRAGVVSRQADINIDFPIQLTDGSALTIPLPIPARRACEAEIQYPKSASIDIPKALHELTGEALLTLDGTILAKSMMPTHTIASESNFTGTILFNFRSREEGYYLLSLRVDHVPAGLHNIEGRVKIENDFHHNKDLLGLTLLSRALGVVTVLSIIPLFYFWMRTERRKSEMGSY